MGLVARARVALVILAAQAGVLAPQSAAKSGPHAEVKSAVAVADSLLAAGDLEKSYAVLAVRLAASPDDYEARWRATRGALGLGIVGTTHEIRLEWLREADDQGRKLLKLRPDVPDAMAWAAAARGRRAMSESGVRTLARLARETWTLTGEILAAQPNNALANEVRGKLHQEVARMPAVARLVARVLMGNETVTEASRWDLAEAHLRRAIASDPGLVVSYLDLGETYGYQQKWTEAEATYRQGLAATPRYPVDEQFKSLMRERLAAIQRATGGR